MIYSSVSLSRRRITRARATGAASTRASWETSTASRCLLTARACCRRGSHRRYTRCTSAAVSSSTETPPAAAPRSVCAYTVLASQCIFHSETQTIKDFGLKSKKGPGCVINSSDIKHFSFVFIFGSTLQ